MDITGQGLQIPYIKQMIDANRLGEKDLLVGCGRSITINKWKPLVMKYSAVPI